MTGMRDSPDWTPSDAVAEVLSPESCHIVLDTSPPNYVQKISRYFESSVGQSRLDEVYNEPAEAESDSGDSLFITQKPVPEAVRSARRLHYSTRSNPISPIYLEESEDDNSLSASHGEPKTDRERRRKKYTLPKYSFPFLSERKWKPRSTLLAVRDTTSLHNAAMGGFFKCVTELGQDCQRGDHLESFLPTVDMEGEYISPLSEEEGARSEDEDIKVVEKKCFVAPSKAKRRQIWCNQLKPQKRKKAGTARQETSQGRQWKTLHKLPAKASTSRVTVLSLDTESSDDGESSCRVLLEKERSDVHVTSDGNFLVQTETPKKSRRFTRGNKKILFQQKAWERELCNDSDAAVCEPHKLRRSPRQCTQKGREASTTVTEPESDVFCIDNLSQTGEAEDKPECRNLLHSLPDLISDTNNDRVCNGTRVKKSKKHKGHCESVEEEKSQSQEEPKGVHAATSVNVKVEEIPSLSEDNRAEPPASQTSAEPDFNEKDWMENSSREDNILRQEERDIPDSKPKKRKKNKSAADNVRQEVDGNLESDVRMEVFSVSCNVENGVKKRKKKRKRSGEDQEDVEQLQPSAVAKPLTDDSEVQKKNKKRMKEKRSVITEECDAEEASSRTLDLLPVSTGQLEESGNGLENTAASQEALESSYAKRKKHKKKQQSSSNEATQDGEEGVDVSFSNGAVTLAKSTGMSLKKIKKKKKTISEGVDVSHTPEENGKVENIDNTQKTKESIEDQNAELLAKKKKKKKKKMSEISSRNISEDNVAQSDDSVSARKKEKKRTSSFLVADAEENDAQAEKPGVSAGDLETESAEITGNLEESNDGVRKKKRKMSVVQDSMEKDHKQDFKEPKRTCQSALPETTDTGVKRKKKRMGNESELVTPMERLERGADAGHSPADEAVALKKKKKKKKKCKDEPCHVIQESPQRKKGKHLTKETLNMVEHASPSSETPGNEALHDMRDKKKKKKMKFTHDVLLEEKSSTKSAELEPQESKKKERNKQSTVPSVISSSPMLSETSLSKPEMSSSDRIMKVKRRLHNPSEDFLTDF